MIVAEGDELGTPCGYGRYGRRPPSRKTLDGGLDDVVLFGDEVVEPDSSQQRSLIAIWHIAKSGQAETREQSGVERIAAISCKFEPSFPSVPPSLMLVHEYQT